MYRVISVSKQPSKTNGNALSAGYTYTDDQLTRITTVSTTYALTYGKFGLRTLVKAGSRELAAYKYTNDQNHYLERLDYGNGDKYSASYNYTYDANGNITSISGGTNNNTTYVYDSANQLVRENNQKAGKT